jgi:hypothetical protein
MSPNWPPALKEWGEPPVVVKTMAFLPPRLDVRPGVEERGLRVAA